MDANGWQHWLPLDDQNAWNQYPDMTTHSGIYHEPTLDETLADFTDATDANRQSRSNNDLMLPMSYSMMDYTVQNPANLGATGTSFYNLPHLATSQVSGVDPFVGPSPSQQTLNHVMPATSAYGSYLEGNRVNEQAWLGNFPSITDSQNLVHSPLPLQDHQQNIDQHSPVDPTVNQMTDRSPTLQTTRKTTRFNSQQRNTLQAWYDQHRDDTYASEEELGILQACTGLDARQVRAWLSRARRKEPIVPRRQLTVNVPNKTKPVTAVSEVRATGMIANAPTRSIIENIGDEIVVSSLEVVPSSTRASSRDRDLEDADGWITEDDMPTFVVNTLANSPNNVLHWWMNLLPNSTWEQSEPPALKSLTPPHILPHPSRRDTMETEERTNARKLAKLETAYDNQPDDLRLTPYETYDRNLLSPNHVFQNMEDSRDNSASSEFGRSLMAGSTATRGSGHSGHTSQSTHSGLSHESRKGRRRMHRQYHKQRLSGSGKSDDSSTTGTNECPVCYKVFSCKSSCKRHVQSVHAPSVVWVCGPTAPVAADNEGNELDGSVSPCCFCSQQDCQHRLVECWSKPVRDRTFYRRDNFKQHLVGTHKVNAELVSGLKLGPWERALPVSPHPVQS